MMGESYETGNKNRIHIPQHHMNNRQKMFICINCIVIHILAGPSETDGIITPGFTDVISFGLLVCASLFSLAELPGNRPRM